MSQGNVLVIMSDEHDPRYMGCSSNPWISTPNLDALARRGTRFANAYTPSPICVPARAAFATGQRVHRTRHWDNASPYSGTPKSWGHVLQERGIRVESVGKLHYRSVDDHAGFDAEHLPMHVLGGYGMVWASIRDPYITARDGKRMLGEQIGAGESPYTQYDASLLDIAHQPAEPERPIFSEYHAACSNTAGFMLRKGRWKYHYYVRYEPELFDLDTDPEALHDLAPDPRHAHVLRAMQAERRSICDPEAIDALAKSDQRAMIERYGGVEAASRMGATGATPV